MEFNTPLVNDLKVYDVGLNITPMCDLKACSNSPLNCDLMVSGNTEFNTPSISDLMIHSNTEFNITQNCDLMISIK